MNSSTLSLPFFSYELHTKSYTCVLLEAFRSVTCPNSNVSGDSINLCEDVNL